VEKPVYVEVPIIQKIEVEPIRKPIYYIKNIKETSSANEVAEAYINTIKELNAYTKKLEIIVEPLYKRVDK
jgi:TPP-dependent 2-oxoacid decarboxylase